MRLARFFMATAALALSACVALASDSFEIDGIVWTAHMDDSSKRMFFVNTITRKAQWEDPRRLPPTFADRLWAVIMFAAPFVLLVVGGAGYIMWVKATNPKALQGAKKKKGRSVLEYARTGSVSPARAASPARARPAGSESKDD